MAEWLKAHAWKACVRETVPWVRIPLSPPHNIDFVDIFWFFEQSPRPYHGPARLTWPDDNNGDVVTAVPPAAIKHTDPELSVAAAV
jgi:hypothetical protein